MLLLDSASGLCFRALLLMGSTTIGCGARGAVDAISDVVIRWQAGVFRLLVLRFLPIPYICEHFLFLSICQDGVPCKSILVAPDLNVSRLRLSR